MARGKHIRTRIGKSPIPTGLNDVFIPSLIYGDAIEGTKKLDPLSMSITSVSSIDWVCLVSVSECVRVSLTSTKTGHNPGKSPFEPMSLDLDQIRTGSDTENTHTNTILE